MSVSAEEMEELRQICPDAKEMSEGGVTYILLPALKLPCPPGVVTGVLCPQQHSGYATRLFLSIEIPGKGANWRSHVILSRTWYTPSWKDVAASQRLAAILVQHLRVYR